MRNGNNIPSDHRPPKGVTLSGEDRPGNLITRKAFVARISLLLGATLVGCTPAKILFKAYPSKFKDDPDLVEEYLRAFVVTVIPGAWIGDPNLVRIYTDEYYPFHTHCRFFVSDLASRSADLHGDERFHLLAPADRTRVIREGLRGDAIISRLYQAAVFMCQVSFFGSIYDDEGGCPLIGYPGTGRVYDPDEIYYRDPSPFLSHELTTNGNYV